MALAQYSGAQFFDAQGTAHLEFNYDDVTLAVQSVTYGNTMATTAYAVVKHNGVEVSGSPFPAASGQSGTVNLAGLGLVMTSQQVVHHGQTVTLISLPAGYDVSYRTA